MSEARCPVDLTQAKPLGFQPLYRTLDANPDFTVETQQAKRVRFQPSYQTVPRIAPHQQQSATKKTSGEVIRSVDLLKASLVLVVVGGLVWYFVTRPTSKGSTPKYSAPKRSGAPVVEQGSKNEVPEKSSKLSAAPYPKKELLYRIWTGTNGNRMNATLTGFRNGGIVLKTGNGRFHHVPLEHLSNADLEFIAVASKSQAQPASVIPGLPNMRTWSDSVSTTQTQAMLVAFGPYRVCLLRHDGHLFTYPLNRLSRADINFLRSQNEANRQTARFR